MLLSCVLFMKTNQKASNAACTEATTATTAAKDDSCLFAALLLLAFSKQVCYCFFPGLDTNDVVTPANTPWGQLG